MNGPHDMGGSMNFGPVEPEVDEPVFHARWEARALAVTLAMGAMGQWNIDMSRSRRESLAPADYLSSSYYEIWIKALERLMIEKGLVSADELAGGQPTDSDGAKTRGLRVLAAADVPAVLSAGSPTVRAGQSPARFRVGEAVRARLLNPVGHTRLPRYVRGRPGVVTAVHGLHVYPDTHASGAGECPQWLYTVEFRAADLWGPDTTADSVCVDCWEPYLESGEGEKAA